MTRARVSLKQPQMLKAVFLDLEAIVTAVSATNSAYMLGCKTFVCLHSYGSPGSAALQKKTKAHGKSLGKVNEKQIHLQGV